MQFSWLEGVSKKWKDILVIGRTIERDGKKYHIIGMTMEEDAKLYIIEPYEAPKRRNPKKKQTHRMLLKENETQNPSYLHCREFKIGNKKLCSQGGSGGALIPENYEEIKLFLDMMDAGWNVPEWLKNEEWDRLQLVTLRIENLKRLPKYSPDMPITIKHEPVFEKHLLNRAKSITLEIGKPFSFQFTAHDGEKVQCYINDVTLIDVWEDAKKQFSDVKYRERFSEEQLQEIESNYYKALTQNCPRGMCYIGIEYECSRDINLQFYSKDFLESYPETHSGSATFVMMRLKPDKKTGIHGLPLKGYVIDTPFSPDTTTVAAELLFYMEKTEGWEECINYRLDETNQKELFNEKLCVTKYIDREEWNCTSVFKKGVNIVPAGNTIYSMQVKDKNEEYQKIAEKYDVHFIFDDDIPKIDFYTIPYIDIMATDSLGGYIGTIGEVSDLESSAPICYISKERRCYLVADNFKAFMQNLDSWKNQMTEMETVVFYKTKEEAEAANDFL